MSEPQTRRDARERALSAIGRIIAAAKELAHAESVFRRRRKPRRKNVSNKSRRDAVR